MNAMWPTNNTLLQYYKNCAKCFKQIEINCRYKMDDECIKEILRAGFEPATYG